ncbi:adenosylmethionine decarboxylase [Shewanella sp. SG44-2]|uniref:adenosylmethionine decarboxylase n=1 Tax=Shewanella sp. SG44-2 TaxID=2760962 RepID=UPI001600FF97|nr:adenosylmethionine decarboxylase [Shewanella sp. SG44-2]MBB1426454.1 adenosylmethionine decarboxylase [Shewanella sp. SG44-2]|tara:strand:+ start:12205 stop:13134 length:930 start_codon:yes stop_codon:yes gene_type:complete
MFFEGSEKKLEIIVNASAPKLRSLDRTFWLKLVAASNADILSSISNEYCDAYLLSESSLFVWDDRIVMLTCGASTLAESACYCIEHLGEQAIAYVCYQRKNEYYAHLQASSFSDDVLRLRHFIAGQAYRMGHLDSHHHYIFTTDKHYQASRLDTTNELLMYHISGTVADYLRGDQQSTIQISQMLQLQQLFNGFSVDQHLFSPLGYSINGIRGTEYFTIHITPQENSSYVSVETNIDISSTQVDIFAELVRLLQPNSCDIIGFNSHIANKPFPHYLCLSHCAMTIEQGFNIHFSHYQQNGLEVLSPTLL